MQSFKLKFLGVTILQGVKFPIFLLIFEWALQQCSVTALPVICADAKCMKFVNCFFFNFTAVEHSVATLMPGGKKFILFTLIIACRVNNCTGWDKNKKTTVL